ncbi:Uncharacterised protein [Yersinia pseudotuberculosis]|nr:Uncharacterised protein [Yersinia pseudotuberculosis]
MAAIAAQLHQLPAQLLQIGGQQALIATLLRVHDHHHRQLSGPFRPLPQQLSGKLPQGADIIHPQPAALCTLV